MRSVRIAIVLEVLSLLATPLLRSFKCFEAVCKSLERREDVASRALGRFEVLALVLPEVVHDSPSSLEELLIDMGHRLCSKAWLCSLLRSVFASFAAHDCVVVPAIAKEGASMAETFSPSVRKVVSPFSFVPSM